MLGDGASGARFASFLGTSPRKSFARQIVQISFTASFYWDSMNGLELILQNFLLFVPPGDINIGLRGFVHYENASPLI